MLVAQIESEQVSAFRFTRLGPFRWSDQVLRSCMDERGGSGQQHVTRLVPDEATHGPPGPRPGERLMYEMIADPATTGAGVMWHVRAKGDARTTLCGQEVTQTVRARPPAMTRRRMLLLAVYDRRPREDAV